MRPFWTPVKKRMCISMPGLNTWEIKRIYEEKKIKQVAFKWPSFWKLIFKSTCFIEIWPLFSSFCVYFEPLLGWKCAYVCHDLRTEKEGIYVKKREYKRSNWHLGDLALEILAWNVHLFQILAIYWATDSSILKPC